MNLSGNRISFFLGPVDIIHFMLLCWWVERGWGGMKNFEG